MGISRNDQDLMPLSFPQLAGHELRRRLLAELGRSDRCPVAAPGRRRHGQALNGPGPGS